MLFVCSCENIQTDELCSPACLSCTFCRFCPPTGSWPGCKASASPAGGTWSTYKCIQIQNIGIKQKWPTSEQAATWLNLFPSTMFGFSGVVVDLEVTGASWASLGRRGDAGPGPGEEGKVEDLLLASELGIFLLRMAEGLREIMLVWAAGSKIFP